MKIARILLCAAACAVWGTAPARAVQPVKIETGHRIKGTVEITLHKFSRLEATRRKAERMKLEKQWPQVRLFQKARFARCVSDPFKIDGLTRIAGQTLEEMVKPLIRPVGPVEMEPWQAALIDEEADARAFLVRTATPGGTMSRYGGPASNVAKLVPEMAMRFAAAFREARADPTMCRFYEGKGKKKVAVQRRCFYAIGFYSAYRDPRWGVSGWKRGSIWKSLHGPGLAADVTGIGRPGSPEAVRWFAIAGRYGLFNPYGPYHRKEWNHYQLTMMKGVPASAAVLKYVGKSHVDITQMWDAADKLIRNTVFLGDPPAARQRRAHRSRVARAGKVRYAKAS